MSPALRHEASMSKSAASSSLRVRASMGCAPSVAAFIIFNNILIAELTVSVDVNACLIALVFNQTPLCKEEAPASL